MMADLFSGVTLLLFSFICHLIIWRLWLPRLQTVALLLIFTIAPFVAITILTIGKYGLQYSAVDVVRIALFYVSFSLVYVVCYSAIENESPTLAIISHIAGARSVGCSNSELIDRFGQGTVIAERLASMEQGGWVTREGDLMQLSSGGRFYAWLFDLAARVFGIAKGG